ncbi:MAG: WxcM-like domain-containing protein [Muribaculaceae bacterium]|nr:WxcM-like domain-containing protein [Muribaculaceae bacterium]
MSALDKVRIIELPKICDPRGNLSFAEGGRHLPFSIKRVFYIYDVPGGECRGGHAHKECSIVLIAVAGSFEVRLTDGKREMTVLLNRANRGVLIPPGVWDTMHDFTTGSVALALASHPYEEEDYIRDYDEFIEYAKSLDH